MYPSISCIEPSAGNNGMFFTFSRAFTAILASSVAYARFIPIFLRRPLYDSLRHPGVSQNSPYFAYEFVFFTKIHAASTDKKKLAPNVGYI